MTQWFGVVIRRGEGDGASTAIRTFSSLTAAFSTAAGSSMRALACTFGAAGSSLSGPMSPTGSPEPVDLDGGTLLPGFIDSHAHPVFAGNQLRHCDLREAETAQGYADLVAAYAREHPRRGVDHRRRLVDGRVPRRHPHPGDARRSGAGPTGLPAQPRRSRRVGQQPGPRARRRRRLDPRPRPTAGSSATPTAARSAPCRKAPPHWSADCFRASPTRTGTSRCSPPSAIC